jgi:hypothetical protein
VLSFLESYSYEAGGNGAAHVLAKLGVQHDSDRIWLDCIPDCVRTIVILEIYYVVL